MAMLTMRARIFSKNTGRKLNLIGNDSVAFDKTKVKCYNCHKRGHLARECQAPMGQDNMSRYVIKKIVPVEIPNSSALVSCDGLAGYDWSDQAEEKPINYALMAYSTPSASSSDSEVSDDEEEEVEMQEIKPSLNRIIFIKATTDNNPKETVKTDEQPNTHRKRAVNAAKAKAKYNAVKGKRGNAVKDLACWVWKPKHNVLDHVSRHISASITLKKFDYVDARESDGFEQIVDFLNANQIKYALMVSPTIYTSCITQFWTTINIKTINDDVRPQTIIDGKKVVITKAFIRHDLKLNDAEGTYCLPNAVIFKELERIGYKKLSEKLTFYKPFFLPQWKFFFHTIIQCISAKTTSWNEFSNTMASAIICLDDNQKFNFSKYILDNLKKNLKAGVSFYMFPRFIQVFINHQIGDMSYRKGIYVNPSLTKKVFANMKRVGTRFSGAITPLFGTMMVQAVEKVGDLPTAVQNMPIPNAPSSFQPYRKHKPRRKERKETKVSPIELHIKDHVLTTSNDPLPSGEDSMQLKELMVLCTNLSNKALNLENKVLEIKSSHKTNIAELESRVEKLVEENMSLTNKLKNIDADAEVNLENVYNLDMAHKETVLSMQDVTDADVKEVAEEMVEVVTTAKIIIDEVSIAGGEHNAANEKPVKDKGKAKLVEEPKVLKSRKAYIAIDEEVARRVEAELNADMTDNIDWNEVVEHVQKIRPLFEEEYNKVQTLFKEGSEMDAERIKDSRKKTRKEKVEKDQTIKKQKGDELEQDNIEKQKLEEEQKAKELKRNLEIVPDDEDDVFVNVTPLSSKPLTIMDYKIYKEGKKEHIQIIRANGNHQMYLAFSIMLKNFDREDLEVLWKIVKDKFKES
uniref:CCHC-type domain-containing protein n=1 Tax=Tanacetum cinerariifolium TaxID=118510 RepID=A0A6L2KGN7_TANCI|nr:hypothetical protein [Tanacetum cinerariifolium]